MSTLRIDNYNENTMHFMTLTVVEWIDIFTKPAYFRIIIDSLKFCRRRKGLKLYEYVIMSNHLHIIVRADEGYKLSQIIGDFKKHTTREILKQLEKDNRKYIPNLINNSFARKKGYTAQIWQRENCAEVVTSDKFLREKTGYIYKNPVRKEYVAEPEDWLYSSARNRIGNDNSIIELDDTWG